MTVATKQTKTLSARGIAVIGRLNASYLAFLALLIVIACITPSILEPAGFMNFLRRGAPLAVVASRCHWPDRPAGAPD